MQPLEKSLRNRLERTVTDARTIAETAAKAALDQLGVGEAAPFSHLQEHERDLRRKLRVHGRQLGDVRDAKTENQEIDRLTEEVAYEHWHRMLFARFLAENNLLMYPDPTSPVAVTLEECEDLAIDEGAANGWELASRFAARMLPQIFRPDSPVFQLTLPPEYEQKLEQLVGELPAEVFKASDSLGWVYQFWQAKKKDEVNASEVKIGARELPAVTQLFTEPYMVSFLLDNSLGAWWAARRLTKTDLATAKSEEELRQKASLPSVPLEYLRFVKGEDGMWTPAAGTFDSWPKHLSELKTLDPCCGSGHFQVAVFLMLVPMRMEQEGLSAKDAVDAVLRENIHGLEIDKRCVELAAFALALTSWKYRDSGGYRQLPELNVACSGLAIRAKKEDWLALAGDNTNLQYALDTLYEQFKNAPVLGSLINPEIGLAKGTLVEIKWEQLGPLLTKALSSEKDDEITEICVVAQGLAKSAEIMTNNYALIATNVPYLKSGYHGETLKQFCELYYPKSKYDLATVFIERCQDFLIDDGALAMVTQQYWLFLKYYEKMRESFIKTKKLGLIARLGPGAFKSISGEVVNVCLQITLKKSPPDNYSHFGFELDSVKGIEQKKQYLLISPIKIAKQESQLNNPDYRISFELSHNSVGLLSSVADFGKGSVSGDGPHYLRKFWEVEALCKGQQLWLNSPTDGHTWSGRDNLILWGLEGHNPEKEVGFALRGQRVFGKKGIAIGKAGKLRFTPYTGELFDDNIAVVCPYEDASFEGIWAYCTSGDFEENLRMLDKKMSVTAGTFTKVPFDSAKWIGTSIIENIRKPYSNNPTQWIFHGHPAQSDEPLQVAVARLLGYRWPAELDGEMELSDEQREWVKRCETLLHLADKDGIVCIPPVRGEMKAEDRLENLLAAAYGSEWSSSKRSELLAQADHAGKTLETWLQEKFFTQHCKLFHHRPFVWHIWDGLRDGFAALVNYHKLDAKLLETLIYTYLGDWISRQKQDITNGVDGAEEKLAAAELLKKRLELILEGEAPYDIFVRWKPIEKQPIGWNPDLNDGVRLNIRPFMSVHDVKKKGAGVLREKPNVKWDKDRGKDVESAPWYTLGLQYEGKEGDRINNHHLKLEDKKKAREEAE
jgi:Eco57I restriction-modification methylase